MYYSMHEGIKIKRRINRFEKESTALAKQNRLLIYEMSHFIQGAYHGCQLPPELSNIPFADRTGFLLSVHSIAIPELEAAYNPSLIERGDHFFLFFRYDTLTKGYSAPLQTKIGYVELDKNFQLLKDKGISWVNTGSNYSEDPRIIESDNQYFLVYNDIISKKNGINYRGVFIGNLIEKKALLRKIGCHLYTKRERFILSIPFPHMKSYLFRILKRMR